MAQIALDEFQAQIRRGIEDYSLHAGVTYLDREFPASIAVQPLYEERYVLLVPAGLSPRKRGAVTWREAADLPLCLLTRDMHNRRILDEVFGDRLTQRIGEREPPRGQRAGIVPLDRYRTPPAPRGPGRRSIACTEGPLPSQSGLISR